MFLKYKKVLFWVGIVNALLLVLLCFILLKQDIDTSNRQKRKPFKANQIIEQASCDDDSHTKKKVSLESVIETTQKPEVEEQSTTNPIPLEWEGPLINVLNYSYKNDDERNQALITMVLQTARYVPRVQQECLMHLAFGLRDDDYESFLKLSTDIGIPLNLRLKFIDEVFTIRPKELTKWLGQNLLMTSDPALISRAKELLKKQEQMELLQSSQPEPPIQDAEPSPVK